MTCYHYYFINLQSLQWNEASFFSPSERFDRSNVPQDCAIVGKFWPEDVCTRSDLTEVAFDDDTTATKTDVFGCWCKLIEWPYDPAGIAELEFSLWGLLKAKTKILQEPKQMSKWIQHPIMDILETTTYINPSCRSRLLFFMSLSFQLRLQGTEKDYLNLGHYC